MNYFTTEFTIFFIGLLASAVAQTPETGSSPARQRMMQKCKENSASAFQHVEASLEKYRNCVSTEIGTDKNENEYNKNIFMTSSESYKLNMVAGKYCQKMSALEQCLKDFIKAMESCLKVEERDNSRMAKDVLTSLRSSICDENGSRLAQLVAPSDFDCIRAEKNWNAIVGCFNSSFEIITLVDGDLTTSFLQVFEDNNFQDMSCTEFSTVRTCLLGILGNCNDKNPAVIVNNTITNAMQVMRCKSEVKPTVKTPNGTRESAISILSMVMFMVIALRLV